VEKNKDLDSLDSLWNFVSVWESPNNFLEGYLAGVYDGKEV